MVLQAMLVESLAARLADADPAALLRDLNGAVATPQARGSPLLCAASALCSSRMPVVQPSQ